MTMLATTVTVMLGKGVLAMVATMAVVGLLRRGTAAHRHLAWTGGLVVLLALPVLERAGPAWTVDLPTWTTGLVDRRGLSPAPPTPAAAPAVPAGPRAPDVPAAREVGHRAVAPEGAAAARERDPHALAPTPAAQGGLQAQERAPWIPGAGTGVLAVWLLGVALSGVRLARRHRAARRLAAGAVPAPPRVAQRARQRAAEMGVTASLDVRVHRGLRVPLVMGAFRPVVVLPADADGWADATLDHVLLHEAAHVRRRDPLIHLIADAVRCLHWIDPLVWVAVRGLRAESERACDDRVLAAGRSASGYATDLLAVARRLGAGRPEARAAGVAMAREGDLQTRVQAILDPARNRGAAGRGALAWTCGAVVAASVALAGLTPEAASGSRHDRGAEPSAPERPAAPAGTRTTPAARSAAGSAAAVLPQEAPSRRCAFRPGDGGVSRQIRVDGARYHLRWEQRDCRVEVEVEGEVTFGADDRTVTSLAEGALFSAEERDGRSGRRVVLRPGPDGGVDRAYRVDGQARPWGPEAEAWLADLLPWLFGETTLNAQARVDRFLREGGVHRVLDEVASFSSASVARAYLDLLSERATLDDAQAARVMEVALGMDADHHKASILTGLARTQGLGTRRLRAPFLRAALSIEADHHARAVLEVLLDEPGLEPEQLDAVAAAAGRIESDHHAAAILTRVVREHGVPATGRSAFLEALRGIEADHHRRAVVEAFLDGGRPTVDERLEVLRLAREVEADHHRAAILQAVASSHRLTPAETAALVDAARGIGADHHVRAVAELLLEQPEPGRDVATAVLDLTAGVDSDHHRLALLTALAAEVPLDGTLRDRYRALADAMGTRRADEALAALERAGR